MVAETLPTVEDVVAILDDIVDEYDLPSGQSRPLARNPIESVIDDAAEIEDDYRRAATMLRRIATVHVFADGNKRTAYTVARAYLDGVGREIAPSKEQRAVVMTHLNRFDIDELATWLETGTIDESRLREPYPG